MGYADIISAQSVEEQTETEETNTNVTEPVTPENVSTETVSIETVTPEVVEANSTLAVAKPVTSSKQRIGFLAGLKDSLKSAFKSM